MVDQKIHAPASQNRPLLSNAEVVNNGSEILSVALGDVGGVDERLVADALTTNIITNLFRVRWEVGNL